MASSATLGLMGLSKGQRMIGKRFRVLPGGLPVNTTTAGAGSVTARVNCAALIFAWGGGGQGSGATGQDPGGGGGAAGYKRVPILAGQTINFNVGAGGTGGGGNGGDTTVTLPDGSVLTAGGGKGVTVSGDPSPGGQGGICSGNWDVGRRGGNGGQGGSGTGGRDGQPGEHGANGGVRAGNEGGGGGGGCLDDYLPTDFLGGTGGNGASNSPGGPAGGGSGGFAATAGAGGVGRVCIFLVAAKQVS